jgi:sortase A
MADPDPDADLPEDRTQRWHRVPELGGPPVRPLPPVPARAGVLEAPPPLDDLMEEDVDPGWVAAPRPRDPLWRTAVRGAGELLVTAGMVLLLFVVYEVYVTDVLTAQRQDELSEELRELWGSEPPAAPGTITRVDIGDAFGVLRIPRLGEDYTRVILEGVEEEQLSQGPGHYVDSAMPGEQGNVGLAGHRVGKGSPFLELDTMRPGDPIVVETADSWFVYRVLGDQATGDVDADPSGIPGMHIVDPSAVQVVSPTPNAAAGVAPSGAYLTLTTCHPRYSARQRLIIHARLDGGALSKAQYPDGPDALYER